MLIYHSYSPFTYILSFSSLLMLEHFRFSPKMLVRDSVGILSLLRWQNKKKVVNVWSHHHTQWAEKRKKANNYFKNEYEENLFGYWNEMSRGLEVLF